MQLFQFDEHYLRLLRQSHRSTQDHFVSYFTKLLRIKLRSKKLTAEHVFDVQQETFLRVLVAVRRGEIHQPDRLGSFVNSTCNNVLFEWYRDNSRIRHADVDSVDMADGSMSLEAQMIAQEQARRVRAVIAKLLPRDEAVLRALLQGRDKDEICRELEVNRKYLRVLMHRAIASFREQYRRHAGRMNHAARR